MHKGGSYEPGREVFMSQDEMFPPEEINFARGDMELQDKKKASSKRDVQKRKVQKALRLAGTDGATDGELRDALNMSLDVVRGIRRGMSRTGEIEPTGKKRRGSNGSLSPVWKIQGEME